MKFLNIIAFFSVLFLFSCKNDIVNLSELTEISSEIKKEMAPDSRVELFEISFSEVDEKIIISGKTTSKIALETLLDSLQKRNINLENKVRFLPDTAVGNQQFAIAKNSVINIRSEAKHSAELGTQALLGIPLKVLDKDGDFFQIQTPDNYISWVDKGGIVRMTKNEFDAWNSSKKVIFTEVFGFIYKEKSTEKGIVSDISLGGKLQYLDEDANFYQVKMPDTTVGFLKKSEANLYENWLQSVIPSEENIEVFAKKMEGFPYLWGGTSAKGMDCSGFTKMVYLMNGFIIPRDASQQIDAGKIIDENLNFADLQKGDLLFFGKKATENSKQKATHVGIWLGNGKQEFIHASGNVHISSMDSTQPHFDELNKNRYLGSKRYLGEKDAQIVDLKTTINLKK